MNDDHPDTGTPPEEVDDLLGEAFGTSGRGRGNALSRGRHGTVSGDEDLDVDIESCELVAQHYDNATGAGTRLYHVGDDAYALSQYHRSVSGEWAETVEAHGELAVHPAELAREPLADALEERDADPLTDAGFERVQTAYARACEDAIWAGIDSPRTDEGPVLRGALACVEDHTWRETLRPALAPHLDSTQVAAVFDSLMDARPDVEWPWCQLYAVYLARLAFHDAPDDGSDAGD